MAKKVKISNDEINKVVQAVLRKLGNKQFKEDIECCFEFAGKRYKMQFTRRYHKGHASLCHPATCNAGSGCCHLRKVDGIHLCYDDSNTFDLMKYHSDGGLFWSINEETEKNIFQAAQIVLDFISEQP